MAGGARKSRWPYRSATRTMGLFFLCSGARADRNLPCGIPKPSFVDGPPSYNRYRSSPARPPHAERLLRWERLEDRTVLSSVNLPVTSLANAGPGTLRAAITEADSGSAARTYNIEFKVFGTITLGSALPDLSKSMNINGSGERRLTVQRDPDSSSIFSVFVVDANEAGRISGMTSAHGDGTDYGSGGGIINNRTLTVSDTRSSTNTAAISGGGVSNEGMLTVSQTTLSGNSAATGAGISNIGTLTVNDRTNISDNLATTGGGLENSGGGQSEIDSSTVNDGNGGGIVNNAAGRPNTGSTVFIKKTTVDGIRYKERYYS